MGKKSINKIAVCGLGTMGSWIALEILESGYEVTAFDTDLNTKDKFFAQLKTRNIEGSIHAASSLSEIAKTDLIIETIVEDAEIKRSFYKQLHPFLDQDSIVVSNTSILLPDEFLGDFPFRSRFACFHFYSPKTAVDIMPIPETTLEIIDLLMQVAERIGETPILLKKPHAGYLLPTIMGEMSDMALSLIADDFADPHMIDLVWKKVLRMNIGPFGMLDSIGLDTALHIRKARFKKEPNNIKLQKAIQVLEKYVSDGKLGLKNRRGFFSYDSK